MVHLGNLVILQNIWIEFYHSWKTITLRTPDLYSRYNSATLTIPTGIKALLGTSICQLEIPHYIPPRFGCFDSDKKF